MYRHGLLPFPENNEDGGVPMKIKNMDEFKKLLEILQSHDISEVSFKTGLNSFTVKRAERPHASHFIHSTKTTEEADRTEAKRRRNEIEDAPATATHHEIKAPLVGTFYRAPTPGADPFVEIGDQVSAEDTLCIIEAMKSMNEIKADVSGVISDIRAQNGELVEFGQTIILIDQTTPSR